MGSEHRHSMLSTRAPSVLNRGSTALTTLTAGGGNESENDTSDRPGDTSINVDGPPEEHHGETELSEEVGQPNEVAAGLLTRKEALLERRKRKATLNKAARGSTAGSRLSRTTSAAQSLPPDCTTLRWHIAIDVPQGQATASQECLRLNAEV